MFITTISPKTQCTCSLPLDRQNPPPPLTVHTGEASNTAYFYPLTFQIVIELAFKGILLQTFLDSITWFGDLFHSFRILLLKENFTTSNRNLFFHNACEFLLVLQASNLSICLNSKNCSTLKPTNSFAIFNTSI